MSPIGMTWVLGKLFDYRILCAADKIFSRIAEKGTEKSGRTRGPFVLCFSEDYGISCRDLIGTTNLLLSQNHLRNLCL